MTNGSRQSTRDSIAALTTGPDLVQLGDRPSGWSTRLPLRRQLALAVLAPLIFWTLLSSEAAGHPTWALALSSLAAGLSLATYVPLRGQRLPDALGSTCASIGGVVPLFCAASALSTPGSGSLVLAGGFIAFASSSVSAGRPARGRSSSGAARHRSSSGLAQAR